VQFLSKMVGGRPVTLAVALVGIMMMAGCGSSPSTSGGTVTATPVFSPPGGSYNASQTVTIADATAAAVLYCTTDGTVPTTSSPVCTEPTTVSKTEFLQAIAVAPGGMTSALAGAAYTINLAAAATPTLSPAGGTYSAAQTVTVADATPNVNIYYTTDGSVPSAPTTGSTSMLYTAPILVSKNETLSVIAVGPGFDNSGVASAAYIINQNSGGGTPTAAPVFSPGGGAVTSGTTVSISDTTSGATIHYTLDGSTPTSSSTVYGAPIAVTQAETIKAIAIAAGTSSMVTSASYTISTPGGGGGTNPTAAPVFTPGSGAVTSGTLVSLADTTSGATIYYTLDGSTPSASSTQYMAPIAVTQMETINAIAIASGTSSSVTSASYTISNPVTVTPAPLFLLAAGAVPPGTNLSIHDLDGNAAIYYTLDGSTPSASSMKYVNGITLNTAQTVKAIAIDQGNSSAVASAAYTVSSSAVSPLSFSPDTSTVIAGTPVYLLPQNDISAVVYYTLDGSTPTASSTLYTNAQPVTINNTETINAINLDGGSSVVASATYTIGEPAPGFSRIQGSLINSGSPIFLTNADQSATIQYFYTLDGSRPTAASTAYDANNGIVLTSASISTVTINAIAVDGGFTSAVGTGTYLVAAAGVTPPPLITPATGTYSSSQGVTFTDQSGGADTIRYTLDGSTPTITSMPWVNFLPIPIYKTTTVNAIAQDNTTGHLSTVTSAIITIDQGPAATPTISSPTGSYASAQTVTLSDISGGVSIYYTLDGSAPSVSSTLYSGPITVSTTTTINAIAVGGNYDVSPTATATLTIGSGALQLAGTVFSGVSGVGASGPLASATVQVYQAGQGGYGSSATALGSPVTTGSDGSFSISVTCPAHAVTGDDLIYLVATGATSTEKLMTALGSCNGWNSVSSIVINEVTTVASAYALSPFMTTAPNVGSTTSNFQGLFNAFQTVSNLADITSGTALSITPAYKANTATLTNSSTVPQARINTLANMLNACISANGAGSGCSSLFTSATPNGGAAPSDTLQAMLDIAQNPGNNTLDLYSLAQTSQTFSPLLGPSPTVAPTDWTLALTFTGGGLGVTPGTTITANGRTGSGAVGNTSMAIDATGNIWVTAYNLTDQASSSMIVEFNNQGAPLTPATIVNANSTVNWGGYNPRQSTDSVDGPQTVLFDTTGLAWVASTSTNLVQIAPNLSWLQEEEGLNVADDTNQIVFDGTGNAYQSTDDVLFSMLLTNENSWQQEVSGIGTAPTNGYMNPTQLTIDSNGNLWGTDNDGFNNVYRINNTTDLSIAYDPFYTTGSTPLAVYTPLAADNAGNVYGCASIDATSGIGGQSLNVFNAGSTYLTIPISTGRGCGNLMAIDGLGHVFAITGGTNAGIIDEFTPNVTTSTITVNSSPAGYTGTSATEPPTVNPDAVNQPQDGLFFFTLAPSSGLAGAAVDGSGNLWVLNYDTGGPFGGTGNVLVQYVGIAAPVVTPTAVALQNGQLASRP
jgi:hypothetical protein